MDYLSKPDGNILEFLRDPRIWATATGATLTAFLEKQVFPMNRDFFGYAVDGTDGTLVFVGKKAWEEAASPKRFTKLANEEAIRLNRALARAILVGLAVGVIEFVKPSGKDKQADLVIGNLQYVMLGVGSVAIARTLQDFFPVLVSPGRK
jgi:hypothetical protein